MPEAAPIVPELLDADACAALTGICRREWLKLVSKGDVPQPVALPMKKCTRWRRADVLAWIAELPTRT